MWNGLSPKFAKIPNLNGQKGFLNDSYGLILYTCRRLPRSGVDVGLNELGGAGCARASTKLYALQFLVLRIAWSRVQVQSSTLKREENEYAPSGEESEIHCLDICEVPCYGHARWHSDALFGLSRPVANIALVAYKSHRPIMRL